MISEYRGGINPRRASGISKAASQHIGVRRRLVEHPVAGLIVKGRVTCRVQNQSVATGNGPFQVCGVGHYGGIRSGGKIERY